MHDARQNLMDALLRCIEVDDEFADEIAKVARQCERYGNQPVAMALLNMSRHHRVGVIENRAKRAVLSMERV